MYARMKILWAVLIGILFFGGLIVLRQYIDSGSTQAIIQDKPKVSAPKIRIGYEYWPGFLPIVLADRLGYFSDEGIDVESVGYDSYSNLLKDIESNHLDARAGYASEIVESAQEKGIQEQIILLTDYSVGGDGLVARKTAPPIGSVAHPRIALVGSMDFFLIWMLRSLGANSENVVIVNYETEEKSLEAFKNGKIDYIYTYDPYLSDAIDAGGVLDYSSKDAVGVVTDVIAFKKSYIEKYPQAINAFTRAYFKAYEFMMRDPVSAYRVAGKVFDMTEKDFVKQFSGIQMLGLTDNHNAMDINAGVRSIFGNVRMVNLFTSGMRASSMVGNPDMLIYPDAVRSIAVE